MFSSIVSIIGYSFKAISSFLEFKKLKRLVSNKSETIKATLKYLSRRDKVKKIEEDTEKSKAEKIKKEDQVINL